MNYNFTPHLGNQEFRVCYETNIGLRMHTVVAKNEDEVKRIVMRTVGQKTYIRNFSAVNLSKV